MIFSSADKPVSAEFDKFYNFVEKWQISNNLVTSINRKEAFERETFILIILTKLNKLQKKLT